MENASKALIIAGAILLSILIIAIGMYIYNSSTKSINDAVSQISQQEVSTFNNQFSMYEGKQVGTNVKALINKLSAGANENREEATKLPDLCYEATSGKKVEVKSTIADPNIKGFNQARTAIQSRHYYTVGFLTSTDTGLINGVVIEYSEGSLSGAALDYYKVFTPTDK